jgi:deoxyribodipyrimidine photo-lyase
VALASLPLPEPGVLAAETFVRNHLHHVVRDEVRAAESHRGGQRAADEALASFDVAGYAARRNEVFPVHRRGASRLSPYIRHGLLQLGQVWDHVEGGPSKDTTKFRDELLWQEFARHWYARLGTRTARAVRQDIITDRSESRRDVQPWDRELSCMSSTLDELERDGWLVNQTRMWLASQWTVRHGASWRDGEDEMFAHLLDGSRAANRLGWQWTTGVGSSKPYGFSRWQVERRAPGLCSACELRNRCPIEHWPPDPLYAASSEPATTYRDQAVAVTAGPTAVRVTGDPTVVWLTAESLGTNDPALRAHPDLPAVFVFDEPLLTRLRLSSKRLIFLVETLAELSTVRDLTIALGDPVELLGGEQVAVTFAPVPGFRSRQARMNIAVTHPWPWLVAPHSGTIASFSAWRNTAHVKRRT